jgi:hypothetical protein
LNQLNNVEISIIKHLALGLGWKYKSITR